MQITKPVRLIELFAGIGAQAKALENLGVPFEHWRICEIEKHAVASYNAIHGTDFQPSDITKLKYSDLCVTDTDKYCYIMTYSFPCQDLSVAGKQKGMVKGSGTRSGLPAKNIEQSIRVGGRSSYDSKHRWDIIVERED